jgi:hypothetical protein
LVEGSILARDLDPSGEVDPAVLSDWRRAGSAAALSLDLDQAHTAGTDWHQFLVIAEDGDVNAGLGGRLIDRAPCRGLDLLPVYGQGHHTVGHE